MPLWFTIAVGIIIHILLFIQWVDAVRVLGQMQRYGGTVTIHWPFIASHAAFIIFWCWVIFG